MMAAARLSGGIAPFGVAAAAQAGHGLGGACALGGAVLGYLSVCGLDEGLKYAAACVLVFTIAFVMQDMRITDRRWFMPAAAGGVTLLTGILGSIGEGDALSAAAAVSAQTALAAGAAYFFREALGTPERGTEAGELRYSVSVIVFAACALISLSGANIMGVVSLGRLLALLLVMTCAMKGGPLMGAAAGTAFGLAMDAAAGGAPMFALAYALSGLVAGVFGRHGRLAFLLVFILADCAAVFCAWNAERGIAALFETFAASVVFMLIPPAVLGRAGALVQPISPGAGESGLRRFAAKRVEGVARAYGDVCSVVRRATEPVNDGDAAKIFDRAADVACVKCKQKNECWNKSYLDTLDCLNGAVEAMMKRGALEVRDLPERFRENCVHIAEFIAAVNGELRTRALRLQYRSRLEESRAAAWGQYEDFAAILGGVAQELGSINGADPLAERRLIRYLRALDVDADAAVFRDAGGRLRAVIESGQLNALTDDPVYLDKLSGVLGVRLCRQSGGAEGRLTLLEAEPLVVSVGIAALKKQGETTSGDRGTYFKTDSGTLCVILSDGMGSGLSAARESVEAIAILERFLRSGVDPGSAMKILNSVMLLRNGEDWGFATVDLLCIDLFSGRAGFYKYGAAPSYVRTGRTVRRVKGESLAAGLVAGEGATPDVVRMRLKPGSVAVVASDGVITGESDRWLREMMLASEGGDMKTLARQVLKRAEAEGGAADDMTVLAMRVDERA